MRLGDRVEDAHESFTLTEYDGGASQRRSLFPLSYLKCVEGSKIMSAGNPPPIPPSNPYRAPIADGGSSRNNSFDSDLTTGDWVLCVLCSGIACILGIVYLVQGKPKGGKMIGLAFLFSIMWSVLRFGLQMAFQQGQVAP